MDVSRCLSYCQDFSPSEAGSLSPRPAELQPPARRQREELALEGPYTFYFADLPLLRGRSHGPVFRAAVGKWGGGLGSGRDGAGSCSLQSWKPLLQCRQTPRRARALMPGLSKPGPFCGPLFRGRGCACSCLVLGSSLTPCQRSRALRAPDQAPSRAFGEEDAL